MKPQRDPLEEHFDDEDDRKRQIRPVEDALQVGTFVQMNVFEAQSHTGCKNQHQDEPLERGRVHHTQNHLSYLRPLPANGGVDAGVETGTPGRRT
jgi:hypothetical protein